MTYQLPATGTLPQTYRVTLAIVDTKNPDWIISQFAAGVARTVTAENGGRFAEVWDGLDDNFMPVPPGEYAMKGIYMAARQWPVDKEWHSVTPLFAGGASSWLPAPEQTQKPEPFGGDPVNAPFRDVAVGPNGVAVFYYQYLENGTNNPMFDLNKPVGYEQFLRSFNYSQPGEFFAGTIYPNKTNGKIYIGMGKYTPMLHEMEGWSLKDNPVRTLTTVQKIVSISAAQIASPPEIALSLRGGAGQAKVARFAPALGDVAMDGSLSGWESCQPARFQSDKDQTVEVHCLYRPDQILLHWHARLATKFEPKPLPALERVFTHDQLADTLSFYIQGDSNAKPQSSAEGRAGDVRLVFGIFKGSDGTAKPVAVGFHTEWKGKEAAKPQAFRTPVGQAKFAHVGPIVNAQLAHTLDADGKGFVIVAAIPRSAIPHLTQPLSASFGTLVNFEATFGGHNKFWWANSDGSASRETYDEPTEARLYPGSWAQAQFQGLDNGVLIQNWLACGPFGGPGAEKFKADPNGFIAGTTKEMKKAVQEFCEAATYPPDDGEVDMSAIYKGDIIHGYWPDPREVRWQKVSTAPLDNRFIVGLGGQVWYASTWIHSPAETELEFQFQASPMTVSRWSLNGTQIALKPSDYTNTSQETDLEAIRSLKLRAGWNQIFVRSYCFGYVPYRVGLVLNGTAEELWPLMLSSTPH